MGKIFQVITMTKRMRLVGLIFVVLLIAYNPALAQLRLARIYWLGVLPGGTFSRAMAVSNNGRVVGYGDTIPSERTCDSPNPHHAFYWNGSSLIDIHPGASERFSYALDITGDGDLIVGASGALVCYLGGSYYLVEGSYAYAWIVSAGQVQPIRLQGLPNRFASTANSVSYLPYNANPNSRYIAGTEGGVHGSANRGRPGYYLLDSGFVPLPLLRRPDGSEWNWGSANGVSGDGNVVVGVSHYSDEDFVIWSMTRPVCWKGGEIHMLSGEGTPLAASGNGAVIVGSDRDGPVIWLGCPGRLLVLERGLGAARDTDALGRVVVGTLNGRAYRWVAGRTAGEDLNTSYSYLLRDGSFLTEATGISPNGRYIVGSGRNGRTGLTEAYLLDTGLMVIPADVNSDGCVDDADLLSVLSRLGDSGWLQEDVNADLVVDDADLLEVLLHFGFCDE